MTIILRLQERDLRKEKSVQDMRSQYKIWATWLAGALKQSTIWLLDRQGEKKGIIHTSNSRSLWERDFELPVGSCNYALGSYTYASFAVGCGITATLCLQMLEDNFWCLFSPCTLESRTWTQVTGLQSKQHRLLSHLIDPFEKKC